MMTAALALYQNGSVLSLILSHEKNKTYMHPIPRMPAKAHLVLRFICKFHTRAIGKRPRVRSHSVAVIL